MTTNDKAYLPRWVSEESLHKRAGRRTRPELSLCRLQGVFSHIDRPMKVMADLLRRGRYADEAMALLQANPASQ